MPASKDSINLIQIAAKAASEALATDLLALDVSEELAITDIFLLASAASERQVNAVVDRVETALSRHKYQPVRREGRATGRWVLLDYSDAVIHIQHEEERAFYALDRLWQDCPQLELEA